MHSRSKTFGTWAAAMAAVLTAGATSAYGEEKKPAAKGKAEDTAKAAYFCQNNTCKGKSECSGHGGGDGCGGTNDCKGKGWVTAADAKACKAKGGLWKKEAKPG